MPPKAIVGQCPGRSRDRREAIAPSTLARRATIGTAASVSTSSVHEVRSGVEE